jgi:uncharacterized Tic20 family protein
MPEIPIIMIFLTAASVVFILLGRSSRANSNEGAASVNYTIGYMLLMVVVVLIILFFVMNVNVQSVEQSEPDENVTAPP